MAIREGERTEDAPLREFSLADLSIRILELEKLVMDRVGNAKLPADVIQDGVVSGFLQSQNYVTGPSGTGWKLFPDGTLEASDGFFRGDITGASGTFTGGIIASSGVIGGWTISSNRLSASSIFLQSGGTDVARVEVGSGSNIAGINSAIASVGIAFWAGASHANRAAAPFRVTAGGAITASNAVITGNITATTLTATVSGNIAGWVITSNELTGGASDIITGGTIRTSSSGQRIQILGSTNTLEFFDSTGTKRATLQDSGLVLFSSAGIESGRFEGRDTGELDIKTGGGTVFFDGQITVENVIFSLTDIVALDAFVPGISNTTILGEVSPSISEFKEAYINKILGSTGANVIDFSLSGQIKTNQPFGILTAAHSNADMNTVKLFANNTTGNNTELAWSTRGNQTLGSGSPAQDTTISVFVNGTRFFLLASTSAT